MTSSTTSSIKTTWASKTGVNSYELEIDNDGWKDVTISSTSNSGTASGLSFDTRYKLRLRGQGDGVTYQKVWSSYAEFLASTDEDDTDPLPTPPVPTGISTSATRSSITTTWNSQRDVDDYQLQIRINGVWETVADTGTRGTKSGLEANTNYSLRLRGYGDGVTYQEVWGDYATFSETTIVTPPPAPSNVSASIFGDTVANRYGVELVWDLLPGAASFKVERSDDDGVTWLNDSDHVTKGITGVQHSVTGLVCDYDYVFRISALGDGSRYLAEYGPTRLVTRYVPFGQRSVKSDAGDFPCSKPTVSVIPLLGRKVRIEWEYRMGATYFPEYSPIQADGTEGGWTNLYIGGTGGTSIVLDFDDDNDLGGFFNEKEGFGFRVKASLGGQETDYTEVILIDTPIVRALGGSAGRVSLAWTDIDSVLGGQRLYTVGAYSVRIRKLGNSSAGLPHTSKDWEPDSFVDSNGMPDEYGEKVHIDANSREITGLETEQIYAIQVIASVTKKGSAIPTAVFAVRDMYVWPSASPPNNGDRVGSFPLTSLLHNKT